MAFGLGRNRSARVAAWLLPVVALGGLQLGLISAVESTSGPKASDRWYPTAVGTTWLYSSRSNGRDAGTHLAQVVGHGFTLDGPAAVVESRWDDLLGNGPARQVLYLEAGDDRLLIHGQRANGFYAPYDPPQPQWERSQSPGASFTWTGTFGIEEQRLTTTLEAREDLVVAGEDQPGCEHYRTVSTVTTDGGEVERTYDAWL
ncbi:MAG: hypothetical protein QOE93_1629, partial [Actinomycetota bacterium]|nr:hypothetical protein [Actinomycetota bacterium]